MTREVSAWSGVGKEAARVAEQLRLRGWVQGAYSVPDGRCDLVGAALGTKKRQRYSETNPVSRRLFAAIEAAWRGNLLQYDGFWVFRVNDAREMTLDYLLAILDFIAEFAK